MRAESCAEKGASLPRRRRSSPRRGSAEPVRRLLLRSFFLFDPLSRLIRCVLHLYRRALFSCLLPLGVSLLSGAVVTTSHNCAAERQFRLPVEYGGQRPPTAQWTATAGGAFLLSRRKKEDGGVFVLGGMAGKIVDGQISDGANMGAAMAPAAADTLLSYFSQSGASPADFDAVVTGDLGTLGSRLLLSLLKEHSLDLSAVHMDCGTLLYDTSVQDAHCGASGCGCSAAVLASYFLPILAAGKMKNILFLSTGALMSPTALLQGENILGVAPLLRLSSYPPFS